ncbi:MAG: DUF1232 domain-containing protein [Betaproteobacteria bacterium]|nr:MAG: DUF1232 domain-containing protein [Betaproteobacteria bacterium]
MTSSAREPHIIDAVPERIVREDVRGDARASAEQRAGASQSGHGKGGAAAARSRPTWKRVVIGVLALLYVLSPLDLVPDWIPLVGWLDDIGILAWAARQVFFKRNS